MNYDGLRMIWPRLVALSLLSIGLPRPLEAQEPNPVDPNPVFDPQSYDVCFVHLADAADAGEEAAWKSAVTGLAISLDGEFMIEDELGLYYKFTERTDRDQFLDDADSDLPTGVGTDLFEDIVVYAELVVPGGHVHAGFVPPNDTYFGTQDSFELHDIEAAWGLLPEPLPVTTVAVIDTGITPAQHPDLVGRIVSGGKDFTSDNSLDDNTGHGTHVTGIIAAIPGNGVGIAGAAPELTAQGRVLDVLPMKIWRTNTDRDTTPQMAAKAIKKSVAKGAQVVNMSFGLESSSGTLTDAIELAVDRRVVLVGSAGNYDTQDGIDGSYANNPSPSGIDATKIQPPNNHPDVITVGAVRGHTPPTPADYFNYKWWKSNWGPKVEVSAFGEAVWSTVPPNNWDNLSGTSQAAAHVSALAGLVKAMLPLASVADVRDFIFDNAFPTVRNNGDPLGEKPNKFGTVDFEATIADALDAIPVGPSCFQPVAGAPIKVTSDAKFKDTFCVLPPGGSCDSVQLKDDDDQCAALSALVGTDGALFGVDSLNQNGKQKAAFRTRFALASLPSQSLTVTLSGTLETDDGLDRKLLVQFFNYAKEKWKKPKKEVIATGPFSVTFTVNSNVANLVSSPAGRARIQCKMKKASPASKTVPFRLRVDRIQFVSN